MPEEIHMGLNVDPFGSIHDLRILLAVRRIQLS